MHRILIVDDDMFFRAVITKLLTGHGYEITAAVSGEEALQILQNQTFDLMISDVNMTPMDGMELLQKAHEAYVDMGIIMLTGHDEIEVAIDAMKKGAFDFLVKPFQLNKLFLTVQRSLGCYSSSPDSPPLQSRLNMLDGLVAESACMSKVCELIRRIAPANVTVLLCGESGTDKELIARTLHYYSPRKDAPFIALDFSTLTAEQMELELFGRVNGGASGAQAGSFEAAQGGTLFLNHIDALPLDTQTKLLEVIQNNALCKMGGSYPVKVDVRLIVASSANLETLAKQAAFCENLYYRLSSLHIDIPALRNRAEDLPLLIDQTLRGNLGGGVEMPIIESQAKEILYAYPWPGNTRELEKVLRHTLSLIENGRITKAMLPDEMIAAVEKGPHSHTVTHHHDQLKGQSFKAFLHDKQKELLSRNDVSSG